MEEISAQTPSQTAIELDFAAAVPLYHQLAEQIAVSATRTEPHSAVATEKNLMERAGVSRATVRSAIAELVNQGVLYTKQGLGTFVAPARVEASLDMPSGFTETMLELGRNPTTELVSAEVTIVAHKIAEKIGLDADRPAIVIERIRFIDGTPCMIEQSHFNPSFAPGLHRHDLTGSLYAILKNEYGTTPATGTETIRAVAADHRTASLLNIDSGTPILETIRTSETSHSVPIEFTIRHARADVVAFRVELGGSSGLVDRASDSSVPKVPSE